MRDEDLLRWCDADPVPRFPALANVIEITKNVQPPQWTDLALAFLRKAPDPVTVLQQFVYQFEPTSGRVGSLSTALESNAALLDQLGAFPNLTETIVRLKGEVEQMIVDRRSFEAAINQHMDASFE